MLSAAIDEAMAMFASTGVDNHFPNAIKVSQQHKQHHPQQPQMPDSKSNLFKGCAPYQSRDYSPSVQDRLIQPQMLIAQIVANSKEGVKKSGSSVNCDNSSQLTKNDYENVAKETPAATPAAEQPRGRGGGGGRRLGRHESRYTSGK